MSVNVGDVLPVYADITCGAAVMIATTVVEEIEGYTIMTREGYWDDNGDSLFNPSLFLVIASQ